MGIIRKWIQSLTVPVDEESGQPVVQATVDSATQETLAAILAALTIPAERVPAVSDVNVDGVAATGLISPTGPTPSNGQTFTVGDGIDTVTFEFGDGGHSVVEGNVKVLIDGDSGNLSDNIAQALNENLDVTAVRESAHVNITNNTPGSIGNVQITVSMGTPVLANGMAGGQDLPTPLAADATYCVGVLIQAKSSNRSNILFGDSSSQVIPLAPGQSITINAAPGTKMDLNDVYVGGAAGEGVYVFCQRA